MLALPCLVSYLSQCLVKQRCLHGRIDLLCHNLAGHQGSDGDHLLFHFVLDALLRKLSLSICALDDPCSLRAGLCVFYFPTGNKQTEYTFLLGREEGPYKVFRENGIPYYIGQCREGRRVGVWEIYNEDGTLAITKDYGD